MAATDDASAASAAPQPVTRLHQPMVFRRGSTQIEESEHTQSPGTGSSSGGGGSSTASPDAAQSLRFSASCKEADAVGRAVRMDGAANAVTTVTNAQPYPTVGIIVAKASATTCTVQTYGLVTGASSGLVPLQRYFVGKDGQLATASQVFAAGQYVQVVGFAVTATTLFVQPSGTIGQLAPSHDAGGNDTTPPPSGDGQALLYGGVLTGTDVPAAEFGRRGDTYLQYTDADDILLWGPKSDEAGWGAKGRSLVGRQGNRIYVRDTDPDGSISPAVGDLWLNRQTSTLFDAA